MSNKKDLIRVKGTVIETRPNALFTVKLENGKEIVAFPSGNMRRFRIRIVPGDVVDLELSPHDLTKARIMFRYR